MFEKKNFFKNLGFNSDFFDLTIRFFQSGHELPCDLEIEDALTRGISSFGNEGVIQIGRFGFFLAEIPENLRKTRDVFVIDIVSGEEKQGYTMCSLEIKKKLC